MGKTLTAAQMLSAGRKRPPTAAETGTKALDDQATTQPDVQATKPLDDQVSGPLSDSTTRASSVQATEPLDDQATSQPDVQATKPLDDQVSGPLSDSTTKPLDSHGNKSTKELSTQPELNGHPAATYQRVTVFLTPAQRQWLKLTAKQLPDGLSASDVVRLAISRLTLDVTDGWDLVTNLTDQAHSDAEIFSGRRNRGLPPRAAISA